MTNSEDFQHLARSLDWQTYERFKEAVATGRWPNQEALTAQQRELVLQAIILYEQQHLADDQRTGYLPKKDCNPGPAEVESLQWRENQIIDK